MRRILAPLLFVAVAWAGPASAADYYVDATNGSDATGSGTAPNPWATIGRADQVASTGDTVHIRGGTATYPEQILPPAPGITYQGYGESRPVLTVDPQSQFKQCIRLTVGTDNTIIWGLRCEGSSTEANDFGGFILIQNTDGHQILDSEFEGGDNAIAVQSGGDPQTGNYFIGNLIHPNDPVDTTGCQATPPDACGGSALILQPGADYNLVQDNDIIDGGHDSLQIYSSFNVIRGNRITNPNWRQIGMPGSPTRNVIEGNDIYGALNFTVDQIQNSLQLRGTYNIIRGNRFYDNTANAIRLMQTAGDRIGNKIYHNVFYENGQWGRFTNGVRFDVNDDPDEVDDNDLVNNVFFRNDPESHTGPDMIQLHFGGSVAVGLEGTEIRGNDILFDDSGQDVIEVLNAPLCEDASQPPTPPSTLVAYETCYPSLVSGNLEVDPQFVDAANGDFRLQGTSPLIDAGDFLTRTTASGSGTVVPVEDAAFFSDGLGITGGDILQLETSGSRSMVTAVDITNGTITVSTSLTWSAGEGVHLAYAGDGPDVGAHETGGSGCGLGAEVVPLLALLAAARRLRRR